MRNTRLNFFLKDYLAQISICVAGKEDGSVR